MKSVYLEQITSKIGSGATPKGGSSVYERKGITFIRSQNIHDFKFKGEEIVFLNDIQAEKLKGVTVKPFDILLNITGDSIARACIVNPDYLPARVNQHVSIVRLKDVRHAEYVICYLQFLKSHLLKICGVGGTRNALTKSAIGSLPISFVDNYKIIGRLFSNINTKIDLNNRLNAELETLARTIYDYWFLQFDFPDAAGRPYWSSGGEMRFDEGLGREVPVGWGVESIGALYSSQTDTVNPQNHPDRLFQHYSLPAFDATGTYVEEEGSEIKSNKNSVVVGSLLVSKLNPWFSRVIIVEDVENAIASTEFIVWKPINSIHLLHLRQVATSQHFMAYCTQNATGTSNSHKRVNPGVMGDYKVPYDEGVIENYVNTIKPMLDQIQLNEKQNHHLTHLRDWLLPLLMSGQVTVGEVAEMIKGG